MKWLLFPGGVGLGQNTFLVIAGEQVEAVHAPAANPSKSSSYNRRHRGGRWPAGCGLGLGSLTSRLAFN